MRIATWNIPPLDALDPLLGARGDEVLRAHPYGCTRALASGEVDAALVPALDVLLRTDRWQVVPGAGLASTVRYPYARLELLHGLDRLERIGFDPRDRLEVLLARLLIRENYLVEAGFVPVEGDPARHADGALDGLLRTGAPDARTTRAALVLDLGREWFELTARPLVWGLFAAPAEHLAPDEAKRLRGLAREAPVADASDLEAGPATRLRLDEDDLLGLEELVHHLFYTGALDDIPQLRFTPLFGDAAEAEPPGPPA